jgi:hypothetical protein
MTPALREMDAKESDALYDEVEAFAAKLDVKAQRPAAVSSMRLLGQLGRPQARRWLFKFIGAEHHPALRAHALVALLRCLREQDIRKDEYAKLFPLLEEAEFSEVTRLTLDLLEAHELPEDSRSLLAKLMQSAHSDVQKFALRKMGDVATPATIRTLVDELGDADYRKRDVAASSLRKIPEARVDQRTDGLRRPEQSLEHRRAVAVLRRQVAPRCFRRIVETLAVGDRCRGTHPDRVSPCAQKSRRGIRV